jgi:hypothetical protein
MLDHVLIFHWFISSIPHSGKKKPHSELLFCIFDKLLNEDSGSSSIELDISSDDLNRKFVRRIQESDVKDALKRMKGGKTMGPDGIPIEVWRTLGDVAIVWLTKLFNLIFRSNKMPDEWRRSILVPIFKNKGM